MAQLVLELTQEESIDITTAILTGINVLRYLPSNINVLKFYWGSNGVCLLSKTLSSDPNITTFIITNMSTNKVVAKGKVSRILPFTIVWDSKTDKKVELKNL